MPADVGCDVVVSAVYVISFGEGSREIITTILNPSFDFARIGLVLKGRLGYDLMKFGGCLASLRS